MLLAETAGKFPPAVLVVAVAVALTGWEWPAWLMFSVTLLEPPTWPCVKLFPKCMGTAPCRLGSAKVVWPLPP